MTRTVVHDTFVIDRTYAATPSRVFAAFAEPGQKARWFGDPATESNARHTVDFSVGGRESLAAQAPDGGPVFAYEALYRDIVANERIVYSYDMTMDGRRISVSVATIEFLAHASGGTRLILTEQGAFLDGLDTNAIREQGTAEMLAALERYLEDNPA